MFWHCPFLLFLFKLSPISLSLEFLVKGLSCILGISVHGSTSPWRQLSFELSCSPGQDKGLCGVRERSPESARMSFFLKKSLHFLVPGDLCSAYKQQGLARGHTEPCYGDIPGIPLQTRTRDWWKLSHQTEILADHCCRSVKHIFPEMGSMQEHLGNDSLHPGVKSSWTKSVQSLSSHSLLELACTAGCRSSCPGAGMPSLWPSASTEPVGNSLVKVLKTQSRKQGSCKYPAGKGENGLALLWVRVIAPCGKQVGGGKAAARTTRKLFQGTSWIENSAKYIYLKIKWTLKKKRILCSFN